MNDSVNTSNFYVTMLAVQNRREARFAFASRTMGKEGLLLLAVWILLAEERT